MVRQGWIPGLHWIHRVRNKVLRIRDLVLFWPRDPGWVKNQDPGSGSGMNIPDHIS